MGLTLQIEVRELKPELLQDYLRFFDQAFSDFPHWAGCYCGFYDTPGQDWDPTAKAGPSIAPLDPNKSAWARLRDYSPTLTISL